MCGFCFGATISQTEPVSDVIEFEDLQNLKCRTPVRICRPKIEKLAFQAKGEQIFALAKFCGGYIPCPFSSFML